MKLIYNEIMKAVKSFRSKSVNMEKLITPDTLHTLSFYECRIILLIQCQKGMKIGVDSAEENQEFIISMKENKTIFPNPNLFYKAINNLTIKGFITKIDGKQSTYYVNPSIISNMTYQQEIDTGIKKDFRGK